MFIMDFCYIMLREIHSERECSNMRKIGKKKKRFCLDSPRVANLGRCHAYLGCRNMLLRDFHLPLFVTDKWVKCYM